MSTTFVKRAALAFAVLALLAGGLQLLAFGATGETYRVVVGVFGVAIGASVLVAVVRGRGRFGDSQQ